MASVEDLYFSGPLRIFYAPVDAPPPTELDPRTPQGQEWWTELTAPRREPEDDDA